MVINRRGWLRIVEASISIILILGAVLLFYQTRSSKVTDNFASELPAIADEIAKNLTIREGIIELDMSQQSNVLAIQSQINSFLGERITRVDLNYTALICRMNESCSIDNPSDLNGNLYNYERIIAANVNSTNFDIGTTPKKLRLYIWKTK